MCKAINIEPRHIIISDPYSDTGAPYRFIPVFGNKEIYGYILSNGPDRDIDIPFIYFIELLKAGKELDRVYDPRFGENGDGDIVVPIPKLENPAPLDIELIKKTFIRDEFIRDIEN
jgi:hypothetical protein